MKFSYATDARPVYGFTIRRGIHRGGFGEVYYAVSDAGKEVALKLLTHDLDTELRGIRQCLNLKHPNLVTIFDVKTDDEGESWVVMEYVNGSNLEEILTAFPNGLPLSEVCDWMQGLVSGVEYLHDRGLIHRDLKPANIYRENGVVKIGDVGLSKRIDGQRRNQHTESIGTVYYMAPEITHGKYGPQVDVYSLAIILYELLTGKLPFNGETSGEILMKQLSAAPDLSVISVNLRQVLAHALEKDPQKRTPSARQLWTEFEQALSPTAIPESHFVNGSRTATLQPPITARRDTDKSRNTTPQPKTEARAEQPRATRTVEKRHYFEFKLGLAALAVVVLLVPWDTKSWQESVESAGVVAVLGGFLMMLLWLREYWRPDDEPYWKPSFFSRFSAGLPQRRPDWSGTLAIGALAGGLFSLVIQLATQNLSHHQHMIGRLDTMVFFTAVTILGAWAVISCRGLAERFAWAARHPRLLHLGAGVAVATAAAWLGDYLMIEIGPNGLGPVRAAFDHLGANPLRGGPHLQPYWLGYAVFFGGVFGLLGKRLDRMQDSRRKTRWSVWPVVMAVVATWLWTRLFVFPTLLGIYWTAAIAASVQLAAPWQPASTSLLRR